LAVSLTVFGLAPSAFAQSKTLSADIDRRIAQVPGATVAVAFHDLATGDNLYLRADESFHAASTMKVPVMIELFRQVDAGTRKLDQGVPLVNHFVSIADGSPYSLNASDDSDSLAYSLVGTRVPLRDLIDHMITRSSNLATNALIELAGAKNANTTAHRLGAANIKVLRGVEDTPAFRAGMNNTTTARDLAVLLEAIETGRAASRASCDAMRDILSRQEFNEEIPAGLPPGTKVAHKTGWITGLHHDSGVVYPENGNPYVLVLLSRNMTDENAGIDAMAAVSRMIYDYATNE